MVNQLNMIKVAPYWNVNKKGLKYVTAVAYIKVAPYWNVNEIVLNGVEFVSPLK